MLAFIKTAETTVTIETKYQVIEGIEQDSLESGHSMYQCI